jgi:hypothetical protein
MVIASFGSSLTLDLADPAWDDELAVYHDPDHDDELHDYYVAVANALLELRTSGVID